MISFSFVPTKEDYIKSFRTYYWSYKLVWMLTIIIICPQLTCISLAFFRGDLGTKFSGYFPLLVFGFLLFFLTYIFVISPIIASRNVEKNERLSTPVHYEIDDEHVMIKTKFSETKLDWGSFQKVIESKDYFLLVYSANKRMFQIIPKRAFASIGDEQVFRNYLNIQIPKKQKSEFNIKSPTVIVVILSLIGFCLIIFAIATVSYINAG